MDHLQHGLDLLHAGQYWDAHEAWEELWQTYPKDCAARHATQALIQFAAICFKPTQAATGRSASGMQRGMKRLITTCRSHLTAAAESGPPPASWNLQNLREALSEIEAIQKDWSQGLVLSQVLQNIDRVARAFEPLKN